jgi:hypothetical protein
MARALSQVPSSRAETRFPSLRLAAPTVRGTVNKVRTRAVPDGGIAALPPIVRLAICPGVSWARHSRAEGTGGRHQPATGRGSLDSLLPDNRQGHDDPPVRTASGLCKASNDDALHPITLLSHRLASPEQEGNGLTEVMQFRCALPRGWRAIGLGELCDFDGSLSGPARPSFPVQ